MGKARFTVVCDFAGGTYVSQFDAADPVEVAMQWAEELLSEKPIPRASGHIAKSVGRKLSDEQPCKLDGLTNVWQVLGSVGDAFYCATIVQTA